MSIYSVISRSLADMDSISLEQMGRVKLMNRIDTKYVIPLRMLPAILEKAKEYYWVQEIDAKRVAIYDTLYYDTPSLDMYRMHHNQHLRRQKVRVRTYVDSQLTFLEIKNKNNKGRTKKKRIPVPPHTAPSAELKPVAEFMQRYCQYDRDCLQPVLYTCFRRITLVNKDMTERLTMDMDVAWKNVMTGETAQLGKVVIVEVKRDGRTTSPMMAVLHDLRLLPFKMSKYCMGIVYTDPNAKKNRFLPKKRIIQKIEKL